MQNYKHRPWPSLLINIVGGIVVFVYAYLYLMGYFYLSSYFGDFGINTIELKFSISDYATATLYPVFNILVSAIIFFLIYKIFGFILKKKPIFLYIILLTIFVIWKIYLFYDFKKNFVKHFDYFFLNSFVLLCIIVLFLLYCEPIKYIKQIKKYKVFLIIFILFLLPILSNKNGKYIAHFNGLYAFDLLFSSKSNPLVNLSTINPIDRQKYLEVDGNPYTTKYLEIEGNSYRALNLLICKDDFFYFSVTSFSIKIVLGTIFNKATYWEQDIKGILDDISDSLIFDKQRQEKIKKFINEEIQNSNEKLKKLKRGEDETYSRLRISSSYANRVLVMLCAYSD